MGPAAVKLTLAGGKLAGKLGNLTVALRAAAVPRAGRAVQLTRKQGKLGAPQILCLGVFYPAAPHDVREDLEKVHSAKYVPLDQNALYGRISHPLLFCLCWLYRLSSSTLGRSAACLWTLA